SVEEACRRVSMDGKPAFSDGSRITVPTVVVQRVRVRSSKFADGQGSVSPYTETVGSGKARVLRDGKVYEAVWSREKADGPTAYRTPGGKPMTFARGQVWVLLVPR
ncbi:DUF3048 C-terminal domain-containing protein, partial [Kitasatospora sp. NPDC058243]|uniref:DUF3048 C-terminal domain-containing protein n=1 Tax=Kitasatospora sp. NPDC058243 TaxID=3346397 RepID=UPI0036D8CA0C